ncbi:integrase catalytic domain-containing protein [Trichonephila clavipes]|nr:integrase catalytic domain-containing protein [Trichonephila clavipes]
MLPIKHPSIPVYHPQVNPVERKNRDLKPRLEILVQDKHDCSLEKLPIIRFALNTAKCETAGQTAAFLNFG